MGFGDSLKKWATSKATEMLTSDQQKQADAAASADAAETQAKSDLGESLIRAAFPKLGEFADRQEAAAAEREAKAEQARRDEIAAMPLATVNISVTGHVTAMWAGQLHCAWSDLAPNDPDPSDPYADKPGVEVQLLAEDTARPNIGGMMLSRWAFQLPGYHGDGTYDLTAIARERDAAGSSYSYEDWVIEFADTDDSQFYFYVDAGQSTVTVSDGGRKLDVTIAMTGAIGDLTATASIAR